METLEQPSPVQNKKQIPLWFIVAAGFVIVLVIVIVVVILQKGGSQNDDNSLRALQEKGTSLTKADLAKLDKTALFYDLFKYMNMQPITEVKSETYYEASTPGQQSQTGDLHFQVDKTFNYSTKQLAFQHSDFSPSRPQDVLASRCFQGKYYNGQSYDGNKVEEWRLNRSGNNLMRCGDATGKLSLKAYPAAPSANPNDGFASGGMTAKQASVFSQELKNSHIIRVNSVKLAQRENKQYIRLDLNVVPQKQADGKRWGMQVMMWSFKETGLDPMLHPYAFTGTGGAGLHAIYYFDPSTQLPVYSRFDTTPAVDDNNRPIPDQADLDHEQTEYSFPSAIQEKPLEDRNLIKLTWLNQEKP